MQQGSIAPTGTWRRWGWTQSTPSDRAKHAGIENLYKFSQTISGPILPRAVAPSVARTSPDARCDLKVALSGRDAPTRQSTRSGHERIAA